MESYQEEAKKGKELHKDQKEALAKYSDVLGQIDCLKELNEQLKKIQAEVCIQGYFCSNQFFFLSILVNKKSKTCFKTSS